MNKKSVVIIVAANFLAVTALAGTMGPVTQQSDWTFGVGFNNAHSFNSEPIIFEAVETHDFSSHTQTSFRYTLGAGVQKTHNRHWQVGAGYEFADWGKSQLGRAREQTKNSGLTLNHLYTNGVLFNRTYLA